MSRHGSDAGWVFVMDVYSRNEMLRRATPKDGPDTKVIFPMMRYIFRTRQFSVSVTTHRDLVHGFIDMNLGKKSNGDTIWRNMAYLTERQVYPLERQELHRIIRLLVSVARKNIATEMLNAL